jgi:transposase
MNDSFFTLGIDPAKQKMTICLLDAMDVQVTDPLDIACTRAGFDGLLALLQRHVPAEARLVVGIECTASLDDNVLSWFASIRDQWHLTLIRADAAQVRHFSGPRPVRGKTDRADARRIARFTSTYAHELAQFNSDPKLLAMQRLVNERLALAELIAAEKNRLRDRLVISFPEFTQVFDDPACETALAVLAKAPTAAQLATKRLSTLAAIRGPAKRSHRVGDLRACSLQTLARSSIASACTPTDATTISRIVVRLQMLLEQKDDIEQQLQLFWSTPMPAGSTPGSQADLAHQIRIADSMPGLDVVGASAVVLRSCGIRRFASSKALAAQLGTCPERTQTGSSLNASHLTYRGDRRARAVLFLATQAACRSDVAFAFHKWRFVLAGKTKMQASCACMNRLVKLLWKLVDTNTAYDPERAITNAMKHHPDLWKTFINQAPELGKTIQKKLQKSLLEV